MFRVTRERIERKGISEVETMIKLGNLLLLRQLTVGQFVFECVNGQQAAFIVGDLFFLKS